MRSPATPLSTPRWCSACSRGSSLSSMATINLPHRSNATPWVEQKAAICLAPAMQRRAFSEPGR